MCKKNIVRADFYPNGQVIPLGFTDNSGKTSYIKRLLSIKCNDQGEEIVRCIVKNRKHTLILKDNKWKIVSD